MFNLKKNKNKIIIGTAQLSSSYGVANFTSRKINKKKIFKFLDFCLLNNFLQFDTAYGYSNEKLLGEYLKQNKLKKKIKIISKIPSIYSKSPNKKIEFIDKSIKKILDNLNYNLDTILFHDQRDALFVLNNFKVIKKIIFSNKIKNIGFSIYDLKYYKIIKKKIKKDKLVIQLPINIINNKFLEKNYPKNFKIHARSIFLQGFLINRKIKKNIKKKYIKLHKKYFSYLDKNLIDPYQLCFEIFKKKNLKKFIIGFDNISQVKYLLTKKKKNNLNFKKHITEIKKIFKKTYINDPRKWI